MFVGEAHAQVAETTKAAGQAADVLLQYQVLGVACVFLLIAVGVLFWVLMRCIDKLGKLTELVAGEISSNKTGNASLAAALERVHAAQASAAAALQEQSHETAKEISEARHAIANHHAGVNAIVELLVRRERGSA